MTSPHATDKVDLNTVQADVWHLFRLLDVTDGILGEMSYVRDGKRDDELDRVNSLTRIARNLAERIGLDIDNNFDAIQCGQTEDAA